MYLRRESRAVGSCIIPSRVCINSSISRSTGKSPFAIIYCVPPKHALDLVPLPELPGVSQAIENMAKRIQVMQEEVRQKLEATNAKYKEAADKKRCEKDRKSVV